MTTNPHHELNRREFLSLVGASMAFAGLAGCSAVRPENIVPYVRMPEDVLPGVPLFFATAVQTSGYGIGVLVESHEGRPIKVEGNPDHPASLGSTDACAQASVLTLYDPDRAQTVTNAGKISTWDALVTELRAQLDSLDANGARLRILTETITSPTFTDLMRQVLAKYPAAQWIQYEPVHHDNSRAGSLLAFGRYVDVQYRFENADVIVALDSDFLACEPGKLRYTREFVARRRAIPGETGMNRLYVVESSPSTTGAMADHRIPLRSSAIAAIARSLDQQETGPAWLNTIMGDLERTRGRNIVIAGECQPPEVHALVHRLNARLGNVGKTVLYTDPIEPHPSEQTHGLRQLTEDMAANRVEALIIIGGNPVYTAPADLEFASRLAQVPLTVHQSLYYDETAASCRWHLPESHYLESWGDVRSYEGSTSLIQPLIVPLYETRSAHELVSAVLGDASRSNYELVLDFWKKQHPGADFQTFWNGAVHDGVVPNTLAAAIAPAVNLQTPPPGLPESSTGLEIVFRPDPSVFDGRWANNAWLQELPKPLTQLVWDNAALMSAATASSLGVKNEDVIALDANGRTVEAPVWVTDGHADQSITVHLGYGRTRAGRIGNNCGFNAYSIRTSDAPWIVSGAKVRRTGKTYPLVTTQRHHEINGRHMVRFATEEEYSRNPRFAPEEVEVPAEDNTLYDHFESVDYAWGMSVDLSACTGCNACVTACQAENNIPVVGKEQVSNSREMHWIRIDAYRAGDASNPQVLFEPMLCQQCENAPCELVCPVEATSHSAEGINEMTYNRCVGTRYCSNNCPYKVRRFNFYEYAEWNIPQFKLLYNPEVTVRSRGVMEKCTYCIQRINRARITAKEEGRKIRDGEVVTACQAVCPAEAIIFGNIKDPNARVTKAKAEPRNYGVLAELNTRPRTTYLARITNPKADLQQRPPQDGKGGVEG